MATRPAFTPRHSTLLTEHPAFGFALALTAGCGLAAAGLVRGYTLQPTPVLVALLCVAAGLCYLHTMTRAKCASSAFALVVALWWGVLGLLWHSLWWQNSQVVLPTQRQTLTGIVVDLPRYTDSTARITLVLTPPDTLPTLYQRRVSLWLRLGNQPRPQVGQALCAHTYWRENHCFAQPTTARDSANANFAAWQRRQGIVASAFASAQAWQLLSDSLAQHLTAQLSWTDRLHLTAMQWRAPLAARYATLLHDTAAIAIAQSITLGDRSLLTSDLRSTYSTAGASHVLALSGLHLGIIYMLIIGGLRLLPLGRYGQRCALVAAIIALWTFSWLVGFPVSVLRSVVMYSLIGLAHWRMEDGFSVNNLGWAAIVVLLVWPAAVADVSFQLSFMAVLGIVVGMPLLRPFRPRWRVLAWAYEMMGVSCCAQLATAPLLVYHFQSFPTYFLVTNSLVALIAPLILALGMATLLLPIPTIEQYIAQALEWCIVTLNTALTHISTWPYHSLYATAHAGQVACCYALLTGSVTALYIWQRNRHFPLSRTTA